MGRPRLGDSEGPPPGSPAPRSPRALFLLCLLLSGRSGCGAQGPGEWTPWRSWSGCSSSCGQGLSVRSRRCSRLPGEQPCWGTTHEYRLCPLPDCPPGSIPFREFQCALHNGHPVLGEQQTFEWVPFYGAPNQCELHCLARGHAFYRSFGRALDGTPCGPGVPGICVAGRCQHAGCDGLLGSDVREDRCGRCGGANDSCLFVQRVFRDAGAFAGYWNVTVIPEGARHLRVTHQSRNRLALMAPDGRYLLNGDRALSPPGTYDVAGARLVYTREASPEETLQADGPTSQDLILQVLLQEPNPGIEFEFWLPRERYGHFQERSQALGWVPRQPQPRGVEPQPEAPVRPASSEPPRASDPAAGLLRYRGTPDAPDTGAPRPPSDTGDPRPADGCPPCPDSRGRAHRLLHYCHSDFVLQAQVLGHDRQAQETRYEVQVQRVFKRRSPLRALEYLWAPGRCPCPSLAVGHLYLLAVRRQLSPDGARDRLVLPRHGYSRPWSPAEDSRLLLASRHCPP